MYFKFDSYFYESYKGKTMNANIVMVIISVLLKLLMGYEIGDMTANALEYTTTRGQTFKDGFIILGCIIIQLIIDKILLNKVAISKEDSEEDAENGFSPIVLDTAIYLFGTILIVVFLGMLGSKTISVTLATMLISIVIMLIVEKEIYIDEPTLKKEGSQNVKGLCEKSFGKDALIDNKIAYNISDITDKNDWIAIIHADGNGLGKVVQKVGKQKDLFMEFSQKLDLATQEAANHAFKVVSNKFADKQIIPIRPVVLSGDDMTVIVRGDLAVHYAKAFISAFEEKTKEHLGEKLKDKHVFDEDKDYLTACAGIAFVKSSYPFYYGYQLAEDLCGEAKKDTKAIYGAYTDYLPPSCMMFHKVQDSYIFDYKDIIKRELTAKDGLSFKAGPYYIHPQKSKNTIDDLINASKRLNSENGDGIKSGIRNWISLRLDDRSKADQRKDRMLQIFKDEGEAAITLLTYENEDNKNCIAYDVLAYYTILNQQTK